MKLTEALMHIIDHNLTQPKPHHKNKDLMTCALQLEQMGKTAGEFNIANQVRMK